MNSWTIYGKNGVAKAEVNELELHDEWMAECFLTVSVKSAEPIDFAVDDYIDYRGERYAIQYDPTLLKKSSRNTYGEGFSYDNIKFVNEAQAKIVRCDFNDIVLNDNELHYTSLPTFPFYCESVDDLLDRILANLEDLYPGEFTIIGLNTVRNKQRADITHNTRYIDEYKKWIDPTFTPNTEPYGKQGVAETVDNINCWNTLAKVHEDFELNFIVRGYTIIVGTVGVFTANKFRYGKGNGLYEIERISDSEQQIVTRLRSYGASTNLPSRYYATLNTQVFGTITQISANTNYASFLIDLAFSTKYFNYRSESYPGTNEFPNYIVRVKANNHTVKGYVTKDYTTGACSIYCESVNPQEDDRDEPDAAELEAFAQSLSVGTRVYFVNYVEKGAFDSAHTDYATENLPDNMAVSRLMLPGFPNQSLYDWAKAHRDEDTPYDDTKGICTINGFTAAFSKDKYRPYIDSPNAEDYGIRPASFYFDGSGDNEDIHPTIEGMTYNNQPIDVIYAADEVTDNGVYAEGKSPDPIFITLPVLGFELDQVWKDDASIEMKDGMCGGRSLKIVSKPVKIDGGYWKCKVERVKDESLDLWFPYNDFQIHSGDHYVLVGIDMPDAYVSAASERLFYASLEALQENHAPRFTFQPRIDELWMERQHNRHLANPAITSLHDTLKSGDIFSFADTDLGIDANIIIDVLTIKENGNNGIPTYEITLRDEKQVSPIQKIQNKVDTLYSGSYNGNTGSGYSPRQIQSLIENEGNTYFLSKQNDDEAQGEIGFRKGLWIKAKELFGINENGDARLNNMTLSGVATINDIKSSNYTGGGMADTGFLLTSNDNTGSSKLTVDNLYVRKKATFEELEVKKITAIAGNQIYSSAANVILRTDYFDGDGNLMGYSITKVPWLLKKVPFLLRGSFFGRLRKTRIFIEGDDIAKIRRVRCYFLAKDDDREVYNLWKVQEFRDGQPIEGTGNDFARCQTMNISNSHRPTYLRGMETKAGNVYWWRRLCGVSSEPVFLQDGREYHYFDVEFNYAEEERLRQEGKRCPWCDLSSGDIPAAGDNVVQFGNDMNTDRMNLIAVEVNGDDAPAHKWYRGIYTFDLTKCWWGGNPRKEMISAASGVEFYTPNFKVVTEYGVAKVPMDRPEVNWTDVATQRDDYSPYGMVRKLYNYDAITHNGSRWLCLTSDGQHWVRPQVFDDPYYVVTDANGNYRHNGNRISNSEYYQLSTEQKEQCIRVSDYTTVEPSLSSGDWKQIVQKGEQGIRGDFKSTVFVRQNSTPTTPTGGSYDNPVPSGWSDGIPAGEQKLWASECTFYGAGGSSGWSTPRQMTDTADFDVEFSSVDNPSAPTGHPNTNTQWSNTSDEDTKWMATSEKHNGEWSNWQVQKIKGEKGDMGIRGDFKSTVFKRSNTTPSTPSGGSYISPVPTGWSDGIPDGEAMVWASVCTFYGAGNSSGWSTPRQMTDTADFDVEFSSVADSPGNPTDNPSNWSNTASSSTIWMATRECHNGVWDNWQVSKIKGEKGNDGYTPQKNVDYFDGQNGKDGWMVTADPANVIITQSLGTNTSSFSSQSVTFTAKKGSVAATIASIGTPSWTHFTGSKNGTIVTVNAPTQDSSNNYYTEGYFTVDVNVTDPDTNGTVTFNIKVPCYANLLGTWKQTVEAGEENIAASKIVYTLGASGNDIESVKTDYTSKRNSIISLQQWRSDKESTYDGYSTSINTLSNTASEHTQQIQQIENSLPGIADIDAWEQGTTNEVAGKTYEEIKVDVTTRIRTKELVPFQPSYGFMFNDASRQTFRVFLVFFNEDKEVCSSKLGSGWLSQSKNGEWIDPEPPSDCCYAAILISYADNTSTITPEQLGGMGIVVGSRNLGSLSYIKQTATQIEAKVNETGVNIEDGTINLYADKVKFYKNKASASSGDTAKLWIDGNDGSLHAEGGGTIGGFEIGTDALGGETVLDSRGYAVMNRHGMLNLQNLNTNDAKALRVNGGAEILGASRKPVIIRNNNSEGVSINANTLNLNNEANNNNVVKIGSSATSEVSINGSAANFGSSTPVTIGNILAVSGVASLGGNIISGSGTQTLPSTPKIGEFYFCKGTSGDMTIQVNSGTSHQIQMSSSGSESTSISINRDAHILVYMETDKWVDFKCN